MHLYVRKHLFHSILKRKKAHFASLTALNSQVINKSMSAYIFLPHRIFRDEVCSIFWVVSLSMTQFRFCNSEVNTALGTNSSTVFLVVFGHKSERSLPLPSYHFIYQSRALMSPKRELVERCPA